MAQVHVHSRPICQTGHEDIIKYFPYNWKVWNRAIRAAIYATIEMGKNNEHFVRKSIHKKVKRLYKYSCVLSCR